MLSPRARAVVQAVYLEGQSLRTAAAELGIRRSTVFDELQRALRALRSAVDEG